MRNVTVLLVLSIISLALVGCSTTGSGAGAGAGGANAGAGPGTGAGAANGSGTTASGAGTPQPGAPQGEQSEAFKLAFAMLKLGETDQPLTKEQAAALLPLWKALNTLGQSDTAAPQELDALVKQIRSNLTAEQQAALDGMQFSMADLDGIAQGLGLSLAAGPGNASPEMRATRQAAMTSGQFPAGGGPGGGMGGGPGGGGGIPGGGAPPEGGFVMPNQATQEAFRAAAAASGFGGSRLGISQNLLTVVIAYLEKLVQ